eukprot:scaffold12829_cov116-Isochrysis_galbana.AAC.10
MGAVVAGRRREVGASFGGPLPARPRCAATRHPARPTRAGYGPEHAPRFGRQPQKVRREGAVEVQLDLVDNGRVQLVGRGLCHSLRAQLVVARHRPGASSRQSLPHDAADGVRNALVHAPFKLCPAGAAERAPPLGTERGEVVGAAHRHPFEQPPVLLEQPAPLGRLRRAGWRDQRDRG